MFHRKSRAWRVMCLVAALAIPRSLRADCTILQGYTENSYDEYVYTSGGQPIEQRELTFAQDGSWWETIYSVQGGYTQTNYYNQNNQLADQQVFLMTSEEADLYSNDMSELYWTDPSQCV